MADIIFALKHAHDNATTPEIAARIKELGFAWSDSAKGCQGSKPDHNNKQRDRIWNSASSNHDKLIGIGTLFYYAKERGWTPPASDLTQWFDQLDNDGVEPSSPHERDGVQSIRAADVVPKDIEWLWRDWLARRKLSILAGAPGAGKSTLAFEFSAIISRGGDLTAHNANKAM